jgi:hypothetical protein
MQKNCQTAKDKETDFLESTLYMLHEQLSDRLQHKEEFLKTNGGGEIISPLKRPEIHFPPGMGDDDSIMRAVLRKDPTQENQRYLEKLSKFFGECCDLEALINVDYEEQEQETINGLRKLFIDLKLSCEETRCKTHTNLMETEVLERYIEEHIGCIGDWNRCIKSLQRRRVSNDDTSR